MMILDLEANDPKGSLVKSSVIIETSSNCDSP